MKKFKKNVAQFKFDFICDRVDCYAKWNCTFNEANNTGIPFLKFKPSFGSIDVFCETYRKE